MGSGVSPADRRGSQVSTLWRDYDYSRNSQGVSERITMENSDLVRFEGEDGRNILWVIPICEEEFTLLLFIRHLYECGSGQDVQQPNVDLHISKRDDQLGTQKESLDEIQGPQKDNQELRFVKPEWVTTLDESEYKAPTSNGSYYAFQALKFDETPKLSL
ncbi:hypothetical protein PIIN_01832 [Serendipita indica DSM 11827]|uniref:Uncharacterized protein n=1 Tax=Serendipita indica (strain DSM 11827) TaxID=1109443 RepID=G4T9J4_SERID|nr:hypothetical protein PIIN_01832 [Serendipita indica DSM 11827]